MILDRFFQVIGQWQVRVDREVGPMRDANAVVEGAPSALQDRDARKDWHKHGRDLLMLDKRSAESCVQQFSRTRWISGAAPWCAFGVDASVLLDEAWAVDLTMHQILQHLPAYERGHYVLFNQIDSSRAPLTFYARWNGSFVIELSVSSRKYTEFAFQLGHEIVHALAHPAVLPSRHKNMKAHVWFEEALCHVGALLSLEGMETYFRTDAGIDDDSPHRAYANAVRRYYDKYFYKPLPEQGQSLRSFALWVRQYEPILRNTKNEERRDLQGQAAMYLIGIAREDPRLWRAMRYLNSSDGRPETDVLSFRKHIEAWHDRTPIELRAPIREIIQMLDQP